MVDGGYRVGAMVINAVRFIPQSRPRLFIVAAKSDREIPTELKTDGPRLCIKNSDNAYANLPKHLQKDWVWWNMPAPRGHRDTLTTLIEENPSGCALAFTRGDRRLLSQMSESNLQKVKEAQKMASVSLERSTSALVGMNTAKSTTGRGSLRPNK